MTSKTSTGLAVIQRVSTLKGIMQAKKKTTTVEKCLSYRLDKVRSDDRKLPFQLLKDVPGILKTSMKHIN